MSGVLRMSSEEISLTPDMGKSVFDLLTLKREKQNAKITKIANI